MKGLPQMKEFDTTQLILFILFLCILIISIVFLIHSIKKLSEKIKAKKIAYVKAHSLLYKKLLELNSNYHFYTDILNCYTYSIDCSSKRKLEVFDYNAFFLDIIEKNISMYQSIITKVFYNRKLYQTYSDEYQKLSKFFCQNNLQTKMSYKAFCKIEYNLYETEKLKPYINATICCLASYTSPKGRNHYVRKWILPFAGLVQNYNKVEHLIKQKATLQYRIKVERSKMSDSLRFDVLKRDHYRCCICGASVKDGVKLHVDHIYPVSKGGKTELNNLQTLCDRCNLGKSNKL